MLSLNSHLITYKKNLSILSIYFKKNFESNCKNLIKRLPLENLTTDYQIENIINEALKNCDFLILKYDQNQDKKLFDLFKNCESLLINLLESVKTQKVNFFFV